MAGKFQHTHARSFGFFGKCFHSLASILLFSFVLQFGFAETASASVAVLCPDLIRQSDQRHLKLVPAPDEETSPRRTGRIPFSDDELLKFLNYLGSEREDFTPKIVKKLGAQVQKISSEFFGDGRSMTADELVAWIQFRFKGWNRGLRRAGLRTDFQWTKEKVIKLWQKLEAEDFELSREALISRDGDVRALSWLLFPDEKAVGAEALMSASDRLFGSIRDAKLASGVAVFERLSWSKEIVVELIREAEKAGQDVSEPTLRRGDTRILVRVSIQLYGIPVLGPNLLEHGRAFFGTWSEALKAAGVDLNKYTAHYHDWTDDELSALLWMSYKNGYPLRYNYYLKEDVPEDWFRLAQQTVGFQVNPVSFAGAVVRRGNWDKMLKKFGVPFEPRKPLLTKRKLISLLQKSFDAGYPKHLGFYNSGASPEWENFAKGIVKKEIKGRQVEYLVEKYFGNWDKMLEHLKLDPNEIRLRMIWTKEKVFQLFDQMTIEHDPVSIEFFRSSGRKVLNRLTRKVFNRKVSGEAILGAISKLFGGIVKARAEHQALIEARTGHENLSVSLP